jgi:hypothetical protein
MNTNMNPESFVGVSKNVFGLAVVANVRLRLCDCQVTIGIRIVAAAELVLLCNEPGTECAMYDRVSARWMSKDPIEYEGGLNLYEYVGGRPTIYLDPSGLVLVAIFGPDELDLAVTQEIARIFNDCLVNHALNPNRCPIGVGSLGIPGLTPASAQQHGILGPIPTGVPGINGFGIYVENKGPDFGNGRFLGQTGGYFVSYNQSASRGQAGDAGRSNHLGEATVLAHEIGLHVIAGISGHPRAAGYIDSSTGTIGGKLSPETCKKMLQNLGIPTK